MLVKLALLKSKTLFPPDPTSKLCLDIFLQIYKTRDAGVNMLHLLGCQIVFNKALRGDCAGKTEKQKCVEMRKSKSENLSV